MNSPNSLFPPESAQSVDGLAYLGHLDSEIAFCGHRFLLRTLKANEELEASLLAKDYQDSFGQVKAHAWAHLAAALIAVDGEENFCPAIGPDPRQHLRAKFHYITENWYWPVGEYLFSRYVELVQRQVEAIQAVEDLSHRSLTNSWHMSDSLTKRDASETTPTDSNSDLSPISPDEMKKLAGSDE